MCPKKDNARTGVPRGRVARHFGQNGPFSALALSHQRASSTDYSAEAGNENSFDVSQARGKAKMTEQVREQTENTVRENTAKVDAAEERTLPEGELGEIVLQEEKVLSRVLRTLKQHRATRKTPLIDYDQELIDLRDQIRNARMEDVPPLIEEMERLQQVASRRAKVTEGIADPSSPYFGRLVLEEEVDDKVRKREVLIGRTTFLDSKTGVRIVDWRDAPISRVYYRYEEGDDYEEMIAGREVYGELLTRRALAIGQGKLRRITAPQGTLIRNARGEWRSAGVSATKLKGGQGAAMRPEKHQKPGQLGVGGGEEREDKSLGEITPLIDARQFELISRPTAGLVVIQGGAGSGKTTIGLHRMAYLAFQDKQRFRSDSMLVVVFNDALVRYISRVLPALGVENVPVTTYERWISRVRDRHLPHLPRGYSDDTPTHVTRLKKHPVMLRLIETRAAEIAADVTRMIVETAKTLDGGGRALRVWRETEGGMPEKLAALEFWLKGKEGKSLPVQSRHSIERAAVQARAKSSGIVDIWAELLTDRGRIGAAFEAYHEGPKPSETELDWAHAWCARRIPPAVAWFEERLEAQRSGEKVQKEASPRGIDGADEVEVPTLDREDDAILLRLYQRLVGPLRSKRAALSYEHLFVDETQDISPLELAVVLDTASDRRSITLAGDVAQKLYMDNGFTSWQAVLGELGLDHVSVEPLKLSYRSTHEILEYATAVLGPLKNEVTGQATRHGAPVELFRFANSGETVAFLADALRTLAREEPLASVCLITRYPEQADLYYKGLKRSEVPNLRRIAEQDFPFRAGIDVTDISQVKGLEFDYVVLLEANMGSFPEDNESRHLMHIAATRAAHQLWVMATGSPSMLIPKELRESV